jgi:hypothetical protein
MTDRIDMKTPLLELYYPLGKRIVHSTGKTAMRVGVCNPVPTVTALPATTFRWKSTDFSGYTDDSAMLFSLCRLYLIWRMDWNEAAGVPLDISLGLIEGQVKNPPMHCPLAETANLRCSGAGWHGKS